MDPSTVSSRRSPALPPNATSATADIWLVVRVPVLSEQMTVVQPSVSTEGSCLRRGPGRGRVRSLRSENCCQEGWGIHVQNNNHAVFSNWTCRFNSCGPSPGRT